MGAKGNKLEFGQMGNSAVGMEQEEHEVVGARLVESVGQCRVFGRAEVQVQVQQRQPLCIADVRPEAQHQVMHQDGRS